MARQFVSVRFNPWDQRSYTYFNDGAPVRIGDRVKVDTKDGTQEVEVVGLPTETPRFPTKPIAGVVDGPAIDAKLLAAGQAVRFEETDLFHDCDEAVQSWIDRDRE